MAGSHYIVVNIKISILVALSALDLPVRNQNEKIKLAVYQQNRILPNILSKFI